MKLRAVEKRTLAGIWTVTYVTGATLFVLSRWVRVASIVGEQHHPLEYWVRVMHATLTYAVLLAIGYLINRHVVPGLRTKARRKAPTGLSILGLFAALAGSALVMLYAGEHDWRNYVTLAHAVLGLSSPVLIYLHVFAVRRTAQ